MEWREFCNQLEQQGYKTKCFTIANVQRIIIAYKDGQYYEIKTDCGFVTAMVKININEYVIKESAIKYFQKVSKS
jgi:nitrite reductase/ring-hydroxylating ferredoxin subunit